VEPSEEDPVVPITVVDGWPLPLPDCHVGAEEAGIIMGELFPTPGLMQLMQAASGVLADKIDEAVNERRDQFHDDRRAVPVRPTPVPPVALNNAESLAAWLVEAYGATGRLLLCDRPGSWWIVNDSDLELVLICAPNTVRKQVLTTPGEPIGSWLENPRHPELVEVAARYGLPLSDRH
jgi:hypothetical protein